MTTVYFIRHAQSDRFVHDDRTRPLTAEGMEDTKKITEVLRDVGIQHIISSPYNRTIQTVTDLSEKLGVPIETDEDFRERNAGAWHGENFLEFIHNQWENFSYHILDGECLADVQKRNISALNRWLKKYSGETIAVATHGTALSTIINYYYPDYNYDSFMRILNYMPYIVKIVIEGKKSLSIEEIMFIEKEYK